MLADPDRYLALARATYAEMALAGITVVGEFHYLHRAPGGAAYADPNAMGQALIQAAREAGIRITLLDTCYLSGGFTDGANPGATGIGADTAAGIHRPLAGHQLRFGDATAAAWQSRFARLSAEAERDDVRIGAAVHSVRAVPRADLPLVVAAAAGRPLHVHLSEQPAENEQCLAAYGLTPSELLARAGALSARTTAVHATHLTDVDIELLGRSGCAISVCPTTERDLADGIGPARRLADAGSSITLGSDQNAVIDLLEEARALEMDQRLLSGQRGRFRLDELIDALTVNGHASLGWSDAGRIEVGARADLVAIRLDSVRTAGVDPGQAIMAATAADVDTVVVDGRIVVRAGRHLALGDVGARLTQAITALESA